jgi:hypothetical protein
VLRIKRSASPICSIIRENYARLAIFAKLRDIQSLSEKIDAPL